MTWPEGIAAAMIALSQHGLAPRNTPSPHDQPDGDPS